MIHKNIDSPTILAIDSTSGACSVSVWKNNKISAYCEEITATQQAKRLIQMVEVALAESDTQYSELSSVACTVGPGSFTGIRIGLASARGIGLAAGIPVLGFNALEVMALGIIGQKASYPILAMLNAGKGEIIYQYFGADLKETCPPTLVAKHLAPAWDAEVTATFPRADFLATLAATYPSHAIAPLPFYVRPADAKLPQNKNTANAAT